MCSMKKSLLLVGCIIMAQTLFAQTWSEWWQQKKTQIKYLGQQIAALQAYAGYLEKGYHIAQQGLTVVNNIKQGDFSLHQAFFNSLSAVNPSVTKYAKVAEIIALQAGILEKYKNSYRQARQSGMLNGNEVNYIHTVFSSLLDDCTNDISELITLTTDGTLQLKDDERLKRIDGLYSDMQDKYSFTQSFCDETSLMAVSRQREQNGAAMVGTLYGLH